MAAIERKIEGTFTSVPGGYLRKASARSTVFIPEESVARFDEETGELYSYAPDYKAMEAAKAPAIHADKPGRYVYYYETHRAPIGCDFESELSHDGKHYVLRPLRSELPRLRGRGIAYDEGYNYYRVTIGAYERICKAHSVREELCFD